MKIWSISEQSVLLALQTPEDVANGAKAQNLSLTFSSDPMNSAIQRLRIEAPNPDAAAIEVTFDKNGLVGTQTLQDRAYIPWDRRPLAEQEADAVAREEEAQKAAERNMKNAAPKKESSLVQEAGDPNAAAGDASKQPEPQVPLPPEPASGSVTPRAGDLAGGVSPGSP